ncbi:methionyl-tRNA formyltransferase [Paraperlucidibaca wandonensis]|uniref:Methionyl-tRNA formyltransferase n=1 Tax=Paraperlucidibaca wandonensis TaxID=1268273 RepID=A0ABW3HIW9_9GAMM|nr:methionyl-tRNA formyltransferase [Paraperlucidibaca sp.]MBQ0723589.1 methionyl-tRNA formyltransferase [Paraperlucidibaca sp.]MBQ0842886.1 methionyl-tRNA formyltransferase [Paraperlucidibaca sp.]
MESHLRIVFAGTPEFAAESLRALLQGHHDVIAVYTQPDRPSGRGRALKPSAVKELALLREIPVLQPLSLKDADAQAELAALKPDLMVVAAYGLILPPDVLAIPRLGCINVHASLLPRWRGAAPIQRAILAGDNETGITIMQMDVGLDTGAMLAKASCPISLRDTGASLHDRLALLGGDALLGVVDSLHDGEELIPEAQDNALATYAAKLSKEEALIDWQQSAEVIERNIRAFNNVPVAHTLLHGEPVRVWQARVLADDISVETPGTILRADKHGLAVACGDGNVLLIETLQLAGGKALPIAQLLNAKRDTLSPQTVFGL